MRVDSDPCRVIWCMQRWFSGAVDDIVWIQCGSWWLTRHISLGKHIGKWCFWGASCDGFMAGSLTLWEMAGCSKRMEMDILEWLVQAQISLMRGFLLPKGKNLSSLFSAEILGYHGTAIKCVNVAQSSHNLNIPEVRNKASFRHYQSHSLSEAE